MAFLFFFFFNSQQLKIIDTFALFASRNFFPRIYILSSVWKPRTLPSTKKLAYRPDIRQTVTSGCCSVLYMPRGECRILRSFERAHTLTPKGWRGSPRLRAERSWQLIFAPFQFTRLLITLFPPPPPSCYAHAAPFFPHYLERIINAWGRDQNCDVHRMTFFVDAG